MNQSSDALLQAKDAICKILDELKPELMKHFGKIEFEDKPDNTLVTILDRKTEEELHARLQKFDSSIGFVGEETGSHNPGNTFWLVDPIDGTEQYVRGEPFCSNMVTLIDNGQPVLAVINEFAANKCYWAIKGGGAYCNDKRIKVGNRPLNRAMIELETKAYEPSGIAMLQAIRKPIFSAINFAASGHSFAGVARGMYEARIVYNGYGKTWDFAPGCLLVSEAGGKVANIGSDNYDYQNLELIAASPSVFDELQKIATQVASQY